MSDDALPCDLGDGLVMRAAASDEDIQRIAGLYALVFEPAQAEATLLLDSYSIIRRQDFVFVEDRTKGVLASSICLLPTTWLYEGVPLRVAELAVVATHPDYRRRGLIRRQMRWFEGQLAAREFDLASICGIYCFYRQFGFEYIIPLGGGYELRPDQIPAPAEGDETCTVRRATAADIPLLQDFLAATGEGLALSQRREPNVWLYQDDPRRSDEEALATYLVYDGARPAGYFRLFPNECPDNAGVRIVEASLLPYRACLAALRLARELAPTRRYAQTVRVMLPASAPLNQVAASLGGRWLAPYSWYVRIPNAVRFLQRIAPALERRLAGSLLAGHSGSLRINLYSDVVELGFSGGRLVDVRSLGPGEGRAACLPWWAAWQLWLGHRSRGELAALYPDVCVDSALHLLVDVLFPRRESWIFPTF